MGSNQCHLIFGKPPTPSPLSSRCVSLREITVHDRVSLYQRVVYHKLAEQQKEGTNAKIVQLTITSAGSPLQL